MCSSNWFQLAPRMAKEVHRVLKQNGLWLMCSFSQDRLFYVEGEIEDETGEITTKEKLWKSSIQKIKLGRSEKSNSLESDEQLFAEDQDVIFLFILQKI